MSYRMRIWVRAHSAMARARRAHHDVEMRIIARLGRDMDDD